MREINEIIIHCTATPEGRLVSVEEIDQWHQDRGWSGIGYHYIIHMDGSISNGRPISKIGAHTKGHNSHSIGIAYIGGIDSAGKAADTRTKAQKQAFVRLIKKLDDLYTIKKISGHRDYANKACPCFDASTYMELLTNPNDSSTKADLFLSKGDKGNTIRIWRQNLIDTGYDIPLSDEFDDLTEQVTRFFQAKRGIKIDGICRPAKLERNGKRT